MLLGKINEENEKVLEKLEAITVCSVCLSNYTEVHPGKVVLVILNLTFFKLCSIVGT